MKTKYKYAIGISFFSLFLLWAFTTKNEVVESIVWPVKVKLGLAKLSSSSTAVAGVGNADEDAKEAFSKYKRLFQFGAIAKFTEEGMKAHNIEMNSLSNTLSKLGYRIDWSISGQPLLSKKDAPQMIS